MLTAGFVVGGRSARRVLIRVIGPSLAEFGLTGTLKQPQITVFGPNGFSVGTAEAWGGQPNADEPAADAQLVGAFALPSGSLDAALAITLDPGPWTMRVTSADGGSGIALVEIYDLP